MATDAQIFDIKTIQVMIYTNDPQNRIIEMKGSIFGFGDTRAFFSDSALYSSEALNELTGYDPVEKRRIFFDQDLFYNFLEFSYSKNPTPDNTINVRGCNFKIMIDALFVVSFPVPKMVKIDKPEGYNCIEINTDFLVKNVREFFQKNIYTHLSTKGKKYTVLDTKWPNIITTNPDYTTSLVQALGIYKNGKEKFENLKKDIIKKKIEKLKASGGNIPAVKPDVDGNVFKSYIIDSGNGKINDIIKLLYEKLKDLQKKFYYYTYLWILYLTTEYDIPDEYFYSRKGGATKVVTPGVFFTQTLYNLIKFNSWYVKSSSSQPVISSSSQPVIIKSNPGSDFKFKDQILDTQNFNPKPHASGEKVLAVPLQNLFSSYIIKEGKQCNIQGSVQNLIINDLEKNYSINTRVSNTQITVSKSLHLEYLTKSLEGNTPGYNYDKLKDFVKKFMGDMNIVGSSNFDMTIKAGTEKNVDNDAQKKFLEAFVDLKKNDMFKSGLCEYGFDTKNGLYYKIRDLIETINFLGNDFKTMVNDLSADSSDTVDIEGIIEEFKIRMVRVNEILEKKDRIDIKEIETLFEEIINEKKKIELSDTVETSRFQNTKKYRDPIWEKLYKESWYKNFANGLLEITQLRRSSNNAINTALGESGQYKISELETLVKTEAEAGIDEINIGGNRGENLPTFKANLFCVVVGGEITDNNRGSIRCPYSSQKIGALLSRLWLKLPENKDLRRTDFVDLTAIIKKVEQDAIAKNKTRKKQKPQEDNGVREIVKGYGLERYDDERIKDFVRRGGDQGFLGNFFGQGQQQDLEKKPQPAAVEQGTEISGYVKQFIEDNIKKITDYTSTGLNTSSFSDRYIINTQDDIIKFLASKEPKTIPILNEAIKLSTETILDDDNKKQKITEKINRLVSQYENTIKDSRSRMRTPIYQNDDTKKQQNYLELYNATIMKNLFDIVSEELESIGVELLSRQDSASSPRVLKKGGSRKRLVSIKRNRTHRK